MRPVSLLIKPFSGGCDLCCDYCFYKDRPGHSRGPMSEETAAAVVRRVFAYADGPVSFAFQGGEPTLAGADFFRRFDSLVTGANVKKLPVSYSIQTNGADAPPELVRVLAEKDFLVGISLDGCRRVHDRYRHFPDGSPSFDRVKNSISAYRAAGADVNLLTVVTEELCQSTGEAWRELAATGVASLQFILCLEGEPGFSHGCAPTADSYGRFLVESFDLWVEHIRSGDYISVRQFDNLAARLLGYPPELCGFGGSCVNQLVVESDGSVYPCDFYVCEEFCLGSVTDKSLPELVSSSVAKAFISGRGGPDESCLTCRWSALCNGGCRREFGTGRKTEMCKAWKHFFSQREDALCFVAELVRRGRIRTGRK